MGRISLIKPDPQGRPNSWANFKKHSGKLIKEALLMLRIRNDLVKDEVSLNRLFYVCLLEASYKLTEIDPTFNLPLPAYDGRNPPYPDDEQKTKREDNRPDIYWSLIDHGADYPDWCRIFALECKRLGEPTSRSWILNEQYVKHGILRFFQEEMGYGKGCETGAMVGYIQDKTFDDILSEINSCINAHEKSIPLLTVPVDGWVHQGVSYLSHTFSRSYIPLCFLLQHFWIDMKDCLYQDAQADRREECESRGYE